MHNFAVELKGKNAKDYDKKRKLLVVAELKIPKIVRR